MRWRTGAATAADGFGGPCGRGRMSAAQCEPTSMGPLLVRCLVFLLDTAPPAAGAWYVDARYAVGDQEVRCYVLPGVSRL